MSVKLIQLLTIIWLILVIVLHVTPSTGTSVSWMHVYHLDKIIHFLLFFPLGIGLKLGFKISNILLLILAVVLAGSLELIQGTILVGRTTDILDFCADILGVVLGIVIINSK